MAKPSIIVVVPVFNEQAQIAKSIRVISEVMAGTGFDYTLLVVDDGSSDDTWAVLEQAKTTEPALAAIRLSRNFGKEAAICAGLEQAPRADAYIVMDADLQHPPALIPEMIRLWREDGFPIVEAMKKTRGSEAAFKQVGAHIFYSLMAKVAALDLRNASDFKLLDARIVDAWKLMDERNAFFRGMIAWVGFKRAKVYFDVPPREIGGSRWGLWRLGKLAIGAITSNSAIPLQMVTTLGLLFLAGAMPLGIHTLYMKFSGHAVSGFTTVIILLLIIGSVLMISLGIIGTYIGNIFEEVKRRPRYLVSAKVGVVKAAEDAAAAERPN